PAPNGCVSSPALQLLSRSAWQQKGSPVDPKHSNGGEEGSKGRRREPGDWREGHKSETTKEGRRKQEACRSRLSPPSKARVGKERAERALHRLRGAY
ncbi:hypothetical protein E2320_013005, partial [Naja naja]